MKRRRTQPKSINAHIFELHPLQRSSSAEPTIANFSPAKPVLPSENEAAKGNKCGGKSMLSITPRFNKDRKYYTASFINPFLFKDSQDAEMLASHENKVRESTLEINCDQILVAKPRKGATCYCCVCRCYYEDYLEHIESNYHRIKLKEAPFSKDITQLIKKVAQNHQRQQQRGVLTRAAKRRLQVFPSECELLSRPRKKLILSSSSCSGSGHLPSKAWGRVSSGQELQAKRQLSTLPKSQALILE